MLKHTILVAAVAGLVLAMAPAVASAAVIPPWGEITGSYRLAFVTSGTTQATSTDIGTYNDFVNAQAVIGGSNVASLGNIWTCLASVDGLDAKTNTNTQSSGDANDVPIYRLDGTLLAANNATLWGGTLASQLNVTQGGATRNTGVWSGTLSDGTEATNVMGTSPQVNFGNSGSTSDWIHYASDRVSDNDNPKSVYALSAPIPEPATMTLLAIGGFGVLLMRRRRRE